MPVHFAERLCLFVLACFVAVSMLAKQSPALATDEIAVAGNGAGCADTSPWKGPTACLDNDDCPRHYFCATGLFTCYCKPRRFSPLESDGLNETDSTIYFEDPVAYRLDP